MKLLRNEKIDYYLALRKTQSKHKTKNEDITLWLIFFWMLSSSKLIRAKEIMQEDQPEKVTLGKAIDDLSIIFKPTHCAFQKLKKLLNKSIPMATIKTGIIQIG